jgi:8-amino-7-oxononanoate synthase
MTNSPTNRFEETLQSYEAAGRRRTLPKLGGRGDVQLELNCANLLNLSSNDYLGLGSDRALREHFLSLPHSSRTHGMAASASRLLTGNHPAYAALEADLSALYHNRAVTIFSSGYHANIGICSSLPASGDLILADKLCHASLIDGMRMSEARLIRYRHLDLNHLEDLLKKHAANYDQVFIASESIFSMDGDCANLKGLVELKQIYNAMLLVDEAHAAGVFGQKGLGVSEHEGLIDDIDLIVGTFGKALASFGAYVVSSNVIRDYLINHARSLIFTTALPPVVVNWTRTTLHRSVAMQKERTHLQALAALLRQELVACNLETRGCSQIVPVILGDNHAACQSSDALRDAGLLAFPIRPPTVPPGTARLRISLCVNMKWEQLNPISSILSVAQSS